MDNFRVFILVTLGTLISATSPQISENGGGKVATPHQYPWMVRLSNAETGHHICGATLLPIPGDNDQSDIALTAAHCIVKVDALELPLGFSRILFPSRNYEDKKNFSLTFGDHNKNMKEIGEQERKVEHMEYHPAWNPVTFRKLTDPFFNMIFNGLNLYLNFRLQHDIAIVKLESPVKFSETIKPIALPKRGDVLSEDTKCTIIGWGAIMVNEKGEEVFPEQLRHLNVTVRGDAYCKKMSWHGNDPSAHEYCVDPGWPGPSACNGDSGGPMICKRNGEWAIHGVTSHGTGLIDNCNSTSGTLIYVKVEPYVDWIAEKIRELSSLVKNNVL